MADKILEVKNATKQFGGLKANEDVTFDVNKGEIVGLVGPNGAGKTTLFNSISGVYELTSGSVFFDGQEITKKNAHQIAMLGIGRTFQIPQTLVDLKVYENVLVGALAKTDTMDEAMKKVDAVLEFCGITHMRDLTAGALNVPQRKRLEIARALATDPKLILLDETMSGLTATERKEAIDLIWKINAEGISVVLIEHNMDVVMSVSNRVVVLVSGRLLMVGTPSEVTSNPEVIEAYLGKKKEAK